MAQSSGLEASKIAIFLSYAVSAFSVLFYLLPYANGKHYLTPFSSTFFITMMYWVITLLLQFMFIINVFFNTSVSSANQSSVIAVVGPHFTIFNILNALWAYFFTMRSFLISEIILFVNLVNLLALYFSHKTIKIRSLPDWLTIHLPVTGIPLAWTLYAIFWNGATLFHSHNKSLLPRLLANFFIWEFLVVPLTLLVLYSDWSVSLATSFLLLGVGFAQMTTKLVALQWIFAFIISGLDFVLSIVYMFSSAVSQTSTGNSNDQAPLLA